MKKGVLIIMQTIDLTDNVLGVFHNWVKVLAKHETKVLVIALQKGIVDLPSNVKLFSLEKENGKSKLNQLCKFYRLILALRNEYQRVLVHMTPIWVLLGYPVWKLLHKKVFLWYAHGTVDIKLRIAHQLVDGIFTSTSEGFRIKSKKVFVLGQGIDTNFFTPILPQPQRNADEYIILSVGRISPSKDYMTLFNSIALLGEAKKDTRVLIYGLPKTEKDQEYFIWLKNEQERLGLHNVEFKGSAIHSEMPKIYNRAHVLVNTSLTGSADKVVLEAMASGINVLSCNDAYREMLEEKYTFASGDSKELAKKLFYFYFNREVSPELRRKVIVEHNVHTLIKRIVALLD